MLKNLIIGLVFVFSPFTLLSQNLKDDVEKIIANNIVSYHVRYALNYDLGLNDSGLLCGDKYFFEKLLHSNYKLKLDISMINSDFPIKGDSLYRVYKQIFLFKGDSINYTYNFSSLQFDNEYLIAINKGNIKFISGNFFKNEIANLFELDEKNPVTFIKFLKYKTYNAHTDKIKFLKSRKDKMYFEAYSKLLNREVIIIVDKKSYDNVIVNLKSKLITY